MDSYIRHWDEKFLAGSWGRYPPEELVRFIGRNFKNVKRDDFRFLEIGCGPGANLWFLHREGYLVSGIDGSKAAIEQAGLRISKENSGLNPHLPDLKIGNFAYLPWADNSFDVVIDIFSLYANTTDVMRLTMKEVQRVLKPGGKFFSKIWGTKTTGYGEGKQIERNTFTDIPRGPCAHMGVAHFFDEAEICNFFRPLELSSLDRILRTDTYSQSTIEEFVVIFSKVI